MSKFYWSALFDFLMQVLTACALVVGLVMVVGLIISLVFA